MLLNFASYTLNNERSGVIAASHTMERFCRKRRLYSGNGSDRGDTAPYESSATPTVENASFCIESKLILDSAPAMSTACTWMNVSDRSGGKE